MEKKKRCIKSDKFMNNNNLLTIKYMTEEEKKQLFERIEKRTNEVADENGNLSFENFLKLTKEFFGQYSPDGGKTFDDTTNADDLPF